MKKGDFIWLTGLLAIIAFMVVPATREIFDTGVADYPYLLGFIKFGVMATMGELMALRIIHGNYKKPVSLMARIVIWGLIGMLITLMFKVFPIGITGAQEAGYLPFEGNKFITALLISTILNLIFAPTFMAFHKFTDTYLDLKAETKGKVSIQDITNRIDWYGFVSFVLMKTVPFFWIPAHTITFLLPSEYRVLAAAFLSIALGALLAMSKKKK